MFLILKSNNPVDHFRELMVQDPLERMWGNSKVMQNLIKVLQKNHPQSS